jgi:hypothetical protein
MLLCEWVGGGVVRMNDEGNKGIDSTLSLIGLFRLFPGLCILRTPRLYFVVIFGIFALLLKTMMTTMTMTLDDDDDDDGMYEQQMNKIYYTNNNNTNNNCQAS